ncbi:hypothetical protein ACFQBQ_12350 [Granulicella cerasi]|uniref:Uncharacterized protein n=1 Tax=Granulicella cerasi TaxID=741063 RepID=A0ABW1ZCD9_9BACT
MRFIQNANPGSRRAESIAAMCLRRVHPDFVSPPLSRFASFLRASQRRKFLSRSMFVMLAMPSLHAQQPPPDAHALQARKHLAGRTNVRGQADAAAELRAQAQHAALLLKPRNANLTAAWTPLGPSSVLSVSYGNVTGRVTSIAFDASDTTGNTLFLGTTGGGVWKSTNAGVPPAQSHSRR